MKTRIQLKGFILFLVMIFAGSISTAAQEVPTSELTKNSSDYLIGAGDLLEVVTWKNEDLSGVFRVRPDGKFSMPLIGDVIAAGKNTDAINMQIQTKLQLFIESPYVSTIIRETASNRVYVLGEVNAPGAYPLEGSLTVLQALALAGGFTEFAIRDRLVLVRGAGEHQQNFTLSYRKILAESGEKYNMILERGDTLVVP
jgi:polysaccharide export outer membrane protein